MTGLPREVRRDCSDEIPLRYGYTLATLDDLSRFAARQSRWHSRMEFSERVDVAWSAIAEHLYASQDRPTWDDLFIAGVGAIRDHQRGYSQFLGRNTDQGHTGESRPRFEAYWGTAAKPTPSAEDAIIDRLALAQIWPRLRPSHREALAALAEHGDHGQAAQALGKNRSTYVNLVNAARKEFLLLWHEGEIPSGRWCRDRRAVKGTDQHTLSYFLRRRRHNRERAQAAEQDTPG